MASTTALFTGLSGLSANARNLDVIGNNIANVNTTAYKSSRMLFSTMFSRTFSAGSVPDGDFGGTNPGQIGLGVAVAGTQRDFSGGALSTTGDQRDLAIEGNGLFIVDRAGSQFYTRAGAFRQNSQNELVNIDGDRLLGFGVDGNFNIVRGQLVNLSVPVGQLTLAEATRNVRLAGNLNAGGDLATTGTSIALGALSLLSGPIGGPGGPALALTSLLTEIERPSTPGQPLFEAGQAIELRDAEKGGRVLPTAQLSVAVASTVQDLVDFLRQALGINADAGANPDGGVPGLSLDPQSGVLTITGNSGLVNHIDLDLTDARVLDAGGNEVGNPFTFTANQAATGESVRTTLVAYDTLGTPVRSDLSLALVSRDDLGTVWRYYIESPDDTDLDLVVGTGTLRFDTFGQLVTSTPVPVRIDRAGTGAANPLLFDLAFASESGSVTALASTRSEIAATFQDGTPLGTLASFAVGADGIITGGFTNGITRTIGQVVLGVFANPEGLIDSGSNLFSQGPNSGSVVVTEPTRLGAGRIVGGALELSNVDLSEEFIKLILTSTGYSAASRVITTTDQLMQQLLVLGR